MIIKLAIKVRVQQFEGGKRINFGFSSKLQPVLWQRYARGTLCQGTPAYQAATSYTQYALSVQRFSSAGVLGDL